MHLHGVHILRPLMTPPLIRKGEGAEVTEVAEVVKVQMVLIPPDPLLQVEGEGRKRMDFLAKSKSQSLVGKRVI